MSVDVTKCPYCEAENNKNWCIQQTETETVYQCVSCLLYFKELAAGMKKASM